MPGVFTDQLGRSVSIAEHPARIISLVPSQTELLHDLGLGDRVVGITKFCVHPSEWFNSKTRIGGTKSLHLDRIRELDPDLIIANKEENDQEQIETLMNEYPVWTSDISTLDEAISMINSIGQITGMATQDLTEEIIRLFSVLQPITPPASVAYLIWNDPIMLAGSSTFVDHLLERIGLMNIARSDRYPEMTIEELKQAAPDHVFLSSEPFPFKEEHKTELGALLPGSRVTLVDGEMFSWYGSRLRYAPTYLQNLLQGL